jgi:hypothetical protein
VRWKGSLILGHQGKKKRESGEDEEVLESSLLGVTTDEIDSDFRHQSSKIWKII